MFNPWFGPLLMASASTIALRSWLMTPVDGRYSAWQRREGARMVAEKVAAMQEAQLHALGLAWRMWFAPWTLFLPGDVPGTRRAMHRAGEEIARPFGRRAAANARRLAARASDPATAIAPVLAAAKVAAPWSGSNVIPLRPRRAPARRG